MIPNIKKQLLTIVSDCQNADIVNKNNLVRASTLYKNGFSTEQMGVISNICEEIKVSRWGHVTSKTFFKDLGVEIKATEVDLFTRDETIQNVLIKLLTRHNVFIETGLKIDLNLYFNQEKFSENIEHIMRHPSHYFIFNHKTITSKDPSDPKVWLCENLVYDTEFLDKYLDVARQKNICIEQLEFFVLANILNLDEQQTEKLMSLYKFNLIDFCGYNRELVGHGPKYQNVLSHFEKVIKNKTKAKEKILDIIDVLLDKSEIVGVSDNGDTYEGYRCNISLVELMTAQVEIPLLENFYKKLILSIKYGRKSSVVEDMMKYLFNKIDIVTIKKPTSRKVQRPEIISIQKDIHKYENSLKSHKI